MKRWYFILPVLVIVALIGLLGYGLTREPGRLPSALIGKPVPEFAVPSVAEADRLVTSDQLTGQVTLFNVWASWCVACRAEHELIAELGRRADVPVYGLNYEDRRGPAQRWLERYGNPFVISAFDPDGSVGMDWGVSGVPETFVIDARGVIRYKQVGPVDRASLEKELLPLLRRLKKQS